MAKVKDIAMQIRGVSYHPEDLHDNLDEDSVVLLRANNIKDGKLILDDVVYVSKSKVAEQQYLQTGDILICASSGSKELVGKAAYIDSVDTPMTFGAFCKVVRPQSEYSEYLGHYFESPFYRNRISELSAGANINNIKNENIDNLEVRLVTEEKQNSIVEILNQLNCLIFLRKQQLAKLDELVKARFVEMFGDPVKNTMDWEIKPLSELGELNRGVSKARPRNSPELLGGPYPLIQTGEVANAKTYITSFNSTYSEKGLAQSKMWPKGTLCITIAANIARTSILTFDACFPDSVVGFISGNMTNELFIHYWFSFFQKILDEQAPQVAQKNINLKILSELNVIVPPLALQNQFAAFVERVDQQKQTVQQSLEKLELMKKALMQEYFG